MHFLQKNATETVKFKSGDTWFWLAELVTYQYGLTLINYVVTTFRLLVYIIAQRASLLLSVNRRVTPARFELATPTLTYYSMLP